MNYLVTGGAGFIGSHVVELLLEKKQTVRVLDDFSSGDKEFLKEKSIELVQGSILDENKVKEAMQGIDCVIHLAAVLDVNESMKNPKKYFETNVQGTLNLLDSASKNNVKKFVFMSSAAVYGENEKLPLKETSETKPISPYGQTKLIGEELCKLYEEICDLKAISIRLFNTYGPRQKPNSSYAGVISIFIDKVKNNETPFIFGDGEQTRDFVYVKDVANACFLASQSKETGVFNIATGKQITLNKLLSTIKRILNSNIEQKHIEERKGDIKHSQADITGAKKLLNYSNFSSLLKGLEETIPR